MITINEELCKGCEICTDFCPKKVLASSNTINKKGYYLPAATHKDKCTGCRLCELMCPELAILISKE
ncbi:MAG: 4Fe-4S binding protein [Candidatus Aminicenantes bacterium]|nr:4Fe-4S binding protein [Candidatus Aminicenantes bacterium]